VNFPPEDDRSWFQAGPDFYNRIKRPVGRITCFRNDSLGNFSEFISAGVALYQITTLVKFHLQILSTSGAVLSIAAGRRKNRISTRLLFREWSPPMHGPDLGDAWQ